MIVQIKVKDGEHNRSWHFESKEVTKVATRFGHEIYKDVDGWFYVYANDGWNYFASMREAGRFIDDTYWGD